MKIQTYIQSFFTTWNVSMCVSNSCTDEEMLMGDDATLMTNTEIVSGDDTVEDAVNNEDFGMNHGCH